MLGRATGEYTPAMNGSQTQMIELIGDWLRLDSADDVAISLRDIDAGAHVVLDGAPIPVLDPIPRGHKVALRPLARLTPIVKYGQIIGHAAADIAAGEHVHLHNVTVLPVQRTEARPTRNPSPDDSRLPNTFHGFRNHGRRSGTRNAIGVLATVNCSADVVRAVVAETRRRILPDHPSVDGVFAITHSGGCGMPVDGRTHIYLRRCLIGAAMNPNVAGVIIIGLGCEVMDGGAVRDAAQMVGIPAIQIGIQEIGGTGRAIRAGVEAAAGLIATANARRRQRVPISDLIIGTQCGGSDAYSGITANPLLGRAGDLLISRGASWALAETPETYGAEHLLTARATSREVADRLLAMMRRWEREVAATGASLDNNPAPGNKAGGLTTIYEKALGAVAKAGSTPLQNVLEYGEAITKPGLTFMDSPGLDDVSTTGLVAGGCNLVAFTTGRGSCLSMNPIPVVKIASTTELYNRMRDDMDFDAGRLITGWDMDEAAYTLAMQIIRVASGDQTAGERQGLGDHTFAPWDVGPTL